MSQGCALLILGSKGQRSRSSSKTEARLDDHEKRLESQSHKLDDNKNEIIGLSEQISRLLQVQSSSSGVTSDGNVHIFSRVAKLG